MWDFRQDRKAVKVNFRYRIQILFYLLSENYFWTASLTHAIL